MTLWTALMQGGRICGESLQLAYINFHGYWTYFHLLLYILQFIG